MLHPSCGPVTECVIMLYVCVATFLPPPTTTALDWNARLQVERCALR